MPLKSSKKRQHEDPLFIDLLSDDDKNKYNELREQFSSPKYKNRRNKSNNVFKNMIRSINTFINKDNNDVYKRSLVCGIVWINDMIIINTHQLRILIDKCKSSINGSFQSIGYEALPSGEEYINHIISLYPFMKNNYSELRQWTARKLVNKEKKCKEINPITSNQNSKNNQIQFQDSFSTSIDSKINISIQQNKYEEISPAPDLTDIINDFTENYSFSFSKENDLMDQNEIFKLNRNDDDLLNDDFLPFIPKFPNHVNNEIDEIKEYQNHFAFNDLNEKLYM